MSASGEGTENLNKEGETPTATVSKGKSPAKDDIDSCSLKDVAPNPIVAPATKADSLEDPAVIEALIEKKLPTDKEKGLDVDSELDFELKWDDDTDLNENQDIADVDLDNAGKELEAHGTSIEKDKDKEADSAFTSIEQKFDTGSTSTSVEKDLDSLDRDTDSASMSIDKYVDKETEGILSSIDEHLDIAGKEVEHLVISGEKSDDIDSVTDERTDTNTVPNTYSDVNVKTMDVGEESQKGIDNETKIIPTSSKEDLLNKEVTVAEDKTFNIDTNVKIDLKTKTSPTESEATSLDEELVYSDAEGDVDDKDLLDEIDATDISNDKLEHTETPMTSDLLTSQKDEIDATDNRKNKLEDTETPMISDLLTSQKGEIDATDNSNNKLEHTERSISSDLLTSQKDEIDASDNSNNKLEHTETPIPSDLLTSQKDKIDATDNSNDKSEHSETLISSDLLTSQKDDKVTAEKDENEMEVDADVITQMTQKSDLNDTISSATDNTSSYDINKDHGLDRPDVMIDIPTQELIDTFDDADETFDNTNGNVDQSVSNIIDKLDIETTGDNTENLTEPKAIEDLIIPEETDETNVDKLLTDEIQTSNNKLAEDIAGPESMDIDNNDTEVTEKLELETTDLETNKPDEQNVNTLKEKVTHADIILEANSEHPKLQQDESLIGEGKSNEDEKESSDNLEKNVEDTVNKDVEAQPSTSKYHQESSDEDQEATDSLGLLAESSRVMDDEDEQEQEPEPEDDDDDEDFDQDDESNQMTAEHSEDSNAQHSEADIPKETMEVDESNDAQAEESNDMAEMDTPDDLPDAAETPDEHDDESSDELDIQIGQVLSQNEVEEVIVAPETLEVTDEAQKAVDDLLEDEKDKESTEVPQVLTITAEKETVEPAESDSETAAGSKLRQLLLGDGESSAAPSEEKKSPSKTKKLEIAKPKNEINIVELEESSSEDDIQVVKQAEKPASPKDVTSVTIPSEIEVMAASAGETSDIQEKDGEVRVSGLPKPQPQKPTRLNTDEISIKTASATEPLVIPETTAAPKAAESKASIDFGLEIFSLDSDDEETEVRSKRKSKLTAVELDKARQTNKCINMNCTSDGSVPLVPASISAAIYYAANQQRGGGLCLYCAKRFEERSECNICTSDGTVPLVPASVSAAIYYAANQQRGGGLCLYCAKRFEERSEKLVEGVKDLTPFLSMDMCLIREEFVEISDSDSDDEPDIVKNDSEIIGEKGAKFLEEQLADMFNETWKKFNMEERLLSAQTEINIEVSQLEEECKEIDAMLNECQRETDKLRNDLYAKFADDRTELPPIAIIDTPTNQWSGLEDGITSPPPVPETRERPKRRSAAAAEPPAKRAAIPLGYAPLDGASTSKPVEAKPTPSADLTAQNDDDNADISVVKLSVEAAPAGLPPPGVAARAALRPGMPVYAMRNSFGAWHKVRIQEVQPKTPGQFTMCRVRFEQPKTMTKLLPARCLAYEQPPEVRLTIGTRVVALFKDHRVSVEKKEEGEKKEAYYSGIVAEIPNPVNNFRYLIFFDDGYAQYVQHANTRLVCECAPRVWDEVHPFSRNFVRDYLRAYPERPMVRLHAGQSIKTEWDGKWWVSKVLQVDASLVLVYFEGKKDNKTEWIYRGSTRLAPLYLELQAAERTRARPLPRAQAARRTEWIYRGSTRLAPLYLELQAAERTRARPLPRAQAARRVSHSSLLLILRRQETEWIYRGSTRLAPLYLELQAAERTRARPLPRAQAARRTEWIYRGSIRLAPLYLELQAAERTRARPLPRAQAARRYNMPYVEYTRSDEDKTAATPTTTPQQTPAQIQAQMEQEIRRQRAVAKKSTALPPAPAAPAPPTPAARDNVTSRVVFYTPKNAIKPHKMVPHTCGPRCRRTDVLALKDLRTYNPLTKPLLSGWERQTVRYRIPATKAVMYRAPCGRRIRNYDELHRYLQAIDSDMGVDLFDFNPTTHCLAEFLLNKCLISKKDLSHGKENVPVPCVNYYDSSLPEFCSYNTERTPTAGVPLNLDPEFLCGCDCTDDCADKSKCACWKMTLEGARTIGLDTNEVGYVYKRLPEPLPSGIYECNSRCKCKQTCLNRVAQHPLQLKLQVFKTANRGWGIRALNDVPKGAFLCVYAGNLLTDATANLDGLNEGDEYLAELDYIEVVEQMKEGFEEDIPEDAKKADELARGYLLQEENESSSMSSSSEEEQEKQNGDDDFRPAMPAGRYTPSEYSKRLRKREKSKKEKEEREKKQKEKDGNEDCITISDDEELREPAHFSAQAGMGGKEFVSKYKSVRTLFGKDEACYIMDAKVQGNIGRYLNHSCTPNVFVQNVFVDTHDPRFPWVAFFALSQIRAGTELTWNYNYDVGSVPGKVLYCYCNAPNCRGRLL
ncbi:uncharacterized protein LOC134677802 [Cydia fagiglandana]|uniref:uncharacterized protein LOC134677802 n=1 Tax=Cydia fagiglandana TaxID=1458189 RepID=UPI002FEE2F2D